MKGGFPGTDPAQRLDLSPWVGYDVLLVNILPVADSNNENHQFVIEDVSDYSKASDAIAPRSGAISAQGLSLCVGVLAALEVSAQPRGQNFRSMLVKF